MSVCIWSYPIGLVLVTLAGQIASAQSKRFHFTDVIIFYNYYIYLEHTYITQVERFLLSG